MNGDNIYGWNFGGTGIGEKVHREITLYSLETSSTPILEVLFLGDNSTVAFDGLGVWSKRSYRVVYQKKLHRNTKSKTCKLTRQFRGDTLW